MTTAARSARTTGVRGARSAITGAAGGAFSGLTGGGGGAVMVPLPTGQLTLSQHRAHATSLAVICFIAASGVIGYLHAGNIEWGLAATLILGRVLGTHAGTRTLVHVPARQIRLPGASASALTG